MKFGICELPYIPLRANNEHRSEMISQILFGESFQIIGKRNNWAEIQLLNDNSCGFIEEKIITVISEKDIVNKEYLICSDINNTILKNHTETITIPIGSKIPKEIIKNNNFSINDNIYEPINIKFPEISNKREFLMQKAIEMQNIPYLWGGCTGWGIDCSGFSQLLFKLININIPKRAEQQSKLGNAICFLEEAQPGDLAFFENEEKQIIHVGVIDENNTIIHASGKIRIDKLDHQGIFNETTKQYSHTLSVIKNLL
ncbi:MAG: C40 family peptidase [Bacteroidales bacterium]|jgi:hypothetical protein|nr:C40 family peptidase [Bacteroidales bacterium]